MKYIVLALSLFITALLIFPHIETSGQSIQATFLPGDDIQGPSAFDQVAPTISKGGNQYLTAWTDYRTGGSNLVIEQSGADIFAARLDSAGNLIDTTPMLLSMDAGDQINPLIAWNGQNWLVAWLSQTPNQSFWSMEVQGLRVSPGGDVLDPAPISIYKYTFTTGAEFTMASDGNNWVIVTRGVSADENDITGVRVAADGTVLDPGGVMLVPGDFSLSFNLGLAFAVDEYLLTYLHMDDLLGLRVDLELGLIDPAAFVVKSTDLSLESPRVASNGSDFFVAWREDNSGTQVGETRGTRISYEGQVLDPGGLAISGPMFIGATDPRVTWDDLHWIVTFKEINFGEDLDDLRAARVTTGGQVMDFGGVSIEPVVTLYSDPEITGAVNGGTQLVWEDIRAGGIALNDTSTFFFSQELTPSAPNVVSYGTPSQPQMDVATNGSGYMLVFLSIISGEERLMAHPLDADGNALLDEPILLDGAINLSRPAVAWNGSLYFVVWSDIGIGSLDNSVVYGQRISPDGSPVDPAPFAIMEGYSPDVAAVGDLFLAVAIQQTFSEIHEPFGVRVQGSDGTILDPTPIQLGFFFAQQPSVAGVDNRWLVSYQRNFSHDDPNAEIRATFLDTDGDSSASFQVATGLNPFLYDPEVASDGIDSLIVWEDSGSDDIQGARVLNDGSVEPVFTISDAADTQDKPAIAWDDTRYVVLYQDMRNTTFFLDERSDIFGTRVDGDGNVLDPDGFPVYSEWIPEAGPAITGDSGLVLLASGIFRDISPYMSYRIGITLMEESLPTPTPTNIPTTTSTPTPIGTATATSTAMSSPTATGMSSSTPTEDILSTPTQTATTSPIEMPFSSFIPLISR